MIDLTIPPKLLPCKRCGYSYGRVLIYVTKLSARRKLKYRISCPGCSYCTKIKNTLQQATEAWNQRG